MRLPSGRPEGVLGRLRVRLRRVAMVTGAGILGAVMCSTFIYWTGSGQDTEDVLANPGSLDRGRRVLGVAEQSAFNLLKRAVVAGRTTTYAGTKYLTSLSGAAVVEINHHPGTGTWTTVRDVDGKDQRSQLVQDADNDVLNDLALETLLRHYTLTMLGPEDCAGRIAHVVEARAAGTRRLAGQFWFDQTTGLMLRRELYGASGVVVRGTSYVDIRIGSAAPTTASAGPDATMLGAPGGVKLTDRQVAAYRDEQWPLPDSLPSGMQRYQATRLGTADHPVFHLSFSDGMYAMSLFVERGRLDAGKLGGVRADKVGEVTVYTSTGLYRTVVWAGSKTVYTLVSDAPDGVTNKVVGAMPHETRGTGLFDRLGRGIKRVGSWFNPFASVTVAGEPAGT